MAIMQNLPPDYNPEQQRQCGGRKGKKEQGLDFASLSFADVAHTGHGSSSVSGLAGEKLSPFS